MVHFHYDLTVRLHACSPPRLTATQLARSSVVNSLIPPAGLSPALTPASRAHQEYSHDPFVPSSLRRPLRPSLRLRRPLRLRLARRGRFQAAPRSLYPEHGEEGVVAATARNPPALTRSAPWLTLSQRESKASSRVARRLPALLRTAPLPEQRRILIAPRRGCP
jgi:hypothetical protein